MTTDGAWMTCSSWSLLLLRAWERQWTVSCVWAFEYILFMLIYAFVQYSQGEKSLLFPSLNLPQVFEILFLISVVQNGCTRFRHTEYIMYGNKTAERGFEKKKSIFWCSHLKHAQYLQCQHGTLHIENTTAGHEFRKWMESNLCLAVNNENRLSDLPILLHTFPWR